MARLDMTDKEEEVAVVANAIGIAIFGDFFRKPYVEISEDDLKSVTFAAKLAIAHLDKLRSDRSWTEAIDAYRVQTPVIRG